MGSRKGGYEDSICSLALHFLFASHFFSVAYCCGSQGGSPAARFSKRLPLGSEVCSGGKATPTTLKTLAQQPCTWERNQSTLPSSSMRIRSSAFKSRITSLCSKSNPAARRHRSSSLSSTNPRKVQNTCPRIVSSRL